MKSKKTYLYTCNEGTFKVKLLGNEDNDFVAVIELLESITRHGPYGSVTFEVGDILRVGAWQVKELTR